MFFPQCKRPNSTSVQSNMNYSYSFAYFNLYDFWQDTKTRNYGTDYKMQACTADRGRIGLGTWVQRHYVYRSLWCFLFSSNLIPLYLPPFASHIHRIIGRVHLGQTVLYSSTLGAVKCRITLFFFPHKQLLDSTTLSQLINAKNLICRWWKRIHLVTIIRNSAHLWYATSVHSFKMNSLFSRQAS
jgi:hypothetical protein